MSNFAYRQPELENHPVPLARFRRSELFQMAVSEGYVDPTKPTPTKDVLMQIIEGQTILPQSDIDEMEKPVVVNLADAHKEKEPTINLPVSKTATTDELTDALLAKNPPLDEEVDLFEGEAEQTPVEIYEEASVLPIMLLKKFLRDSYHIKLERTATKVDALTALKVKLGLPYGDTDQNAT